MWKQLFWGKKDTSNPIPKLNHQLGISRPCGNVQIRLYEFVQIDHQFRKV